MHELDDKPYWEHETGRWMCTSTSDAYHTMLAHPGDNVYIYSRDPVTKQQINIHMYWSPQMTDTTKRRIIKHGKIRQ